MCVCVLLKQPCLQFGLCQKCCDCSSSRSEEEEEEPYLLFVYDALPAFVPLYYRYPYYHQRTRASRDRVSNISISINGDSRVHTQLFYNSSAKLAANKFRNNCGKSLVSKQMWPVPAGNASSIRAASSDKLAMKMAHAFTSSFDVKAVPKS